MNKERRKQLAALIDRIEALNLSEVQSELESIHGDLEGLCDEEQEYFDNMPESMQGGDRGSDAEAAIGELESALEMITAITDALGEASDVGTTIDNARGQ